MRIEEPEVSRRRQRLATVGVAVLAVIAVVLVVLALEHTSRATADANSARPETGNARVHVSAASSTVWLSTDARPA